MKKLVILSFMLSLFACQQKPLDWDELTSEIEQKYSQVKHISVDDFLHENGNNENILIVDVRDQQEYAVSRIPNAIHMQGPDKIMALALETDKDVIVYCSVGYRSAMVAQQLQEMGMTDVANLKGSIFAWANHGLPLNNDEGMTRNVHPYDQHWGQLLDHQVPISYGE